MELDIAYPAIDSFDKGVNELADELADELASELDREVNNELAGELADEPVGLMANEIDEPANLIADETADMLAGELADELDREVSNEGTNELDGEIGECGAAGSPEDNVAVDRDGFHIPAPPEKLYRSFEELERSIHEWSRQHGYELVRRAGR